MQVNGNHFRKAWFKLFVELAKSIMPPNRRLKVLDVGDTAQYWEALRRTWADLKLEMRIANIADDQLVAGYAKIQSDARSLSESLDNSFDIIPSNSVIEHAGEYSDRAAMAAEIRRLTPHYCAQAPNFGFPIEPHFRMPFFHWLSETMRASMLLRWRKIGFRRAETLERAMARVQEIHLLTGRQMAHLFSDAKIRRERVGPFVKSLIAIR